MDFAHDERTKALMATLTEFMDSHVYPAEPVLAQQLSDGPKWTTPQIVEDLKAAARERGLWNLFHDLPNLTYAPLA